MIPTSQFTRWEMEIIPVQMCHQASVRGIYAVAILLVAVCSWLLHVLLWLFYRWASLKEQKGISIIYRWTLKNQHVWYVLFYNWTNWKSWTCLFIWCFASRRIFLYYGVRKLDKAHGKPTTIHRLAQDLPMYDGRESHYELDWNSQRT